MREYLVRYFVFLLVAFESLTINANEKVYLHFDNSSYFLGEDIWFCAYVNDMKTNCPTKLSKILYTEILSPEGDVLDTRVYKIENGMCAGHFYLPTFFKSGFFEIRAYTRFMQNWGADNYFSRVFPVFDEVKNGVYSFKYMLKRERLSYDSEKSDWNRQYLGNLDHKESLPSANEQTETKASDFVQKPVKLSIKVDTSKIEPMSKIRLSIHGTPNTVFSVSVTDADSKYHAKYHGNIKSFLDDKDGAVSSDSKVVLSTYIPPEQSLKLTGRVVKRNTRFMNQDKVKGIASCPVHYAFETSSYVKTDSVMTDYKGRFSIPLRDFYGVSMAQLYSGIQNKHSAITVDKWFSPPARTYRQDEMDVTPVTSNDSVYMYVAENECLHSAMVLNLADEVEWLVDHDEKCRIPKDFNSFYTTSEVVGGIFSHHHFPGGPTRIAFCKDSVLDWIYDGMSSPFVRAKYLVVHSDWKTCDLFNYDNYPCDKMEKNYTYKDGGMTFESYLGASEACKYPSYVIYLFPFDKDEEPSMEYRFNTNLNVRYTSIPGFSQPKYFKVSSEAGDAEQSDYRRTLFWNPFVRTDSEGNASIEFFNNSTCRHLSISAEGETLEGRAVIY